jgi:hypothetical protein
MLLGASFELTQYLRDLLSVGLMAKLCVQEKISKINAELARLELEMELDHDAPLQCKQLGAGGWMKWFSSFGGGGEAELTAAEAVTDAGKFYTI